MKIQNGKKKDIKEVAVIAVEKSYADYIRKCLLEYMGNYIHVNTYSIYDIENKKSIHEKYIVISAFTVFKKVQFKMRKDAVFQVARLALSKQNAEQLKAIPNNTKLLLVNIDYRRCMEVIAQIYEAGFKNLDLVPYSGDYKNLDKSIKIALTPDEVHLIPEGIDKIINIGQRVIDINSVIELSNKIGINEIITSEMIRKAKENILSTTTGLERLLGENESLVEQIKVLIEIMDEGIILTNIVGEIYLCNNNAKTMLKNKSEIIEGFLLSEILPEINIDFDLISGGDSIENIIVFDGKSYIVSVSTILSDGNKRGNIIKLKNFDELEEKQHGIRARITGTKHEARYVFEDIKGNSDIIKEYIAIGKRMAKSDSSVLITGESGTGKEVFAQSIHNASKRRRFNFVAVNCSAIPENLLESEMFGYEEGAFTGAKKGGKIGFLELAHKGTIFLDEIGEMPFSLQSKLLRILEEKKVSRIGSLKLIDIDVRVISATNKEIKELIAENKFRKDLYYRLNVLPIEIPSLRERKEDIPLLIEHFKKEMDCNLKFSDKAMNYLYEYDWVGNIRELRNSIEYLESLGKEFIDIDDLPKYIFKDENKIDNFRIRLDGPILNNTTFLLREGRDISLFEGILRALKFFYDNNERCGRGKIQSKMTEYGYNYTESEIKNGLRKLNDIGYIKSKRGRGGSVITEYGEILLEEIKVLIGH